MKIFDSTSLLSLKRLPGKITVALLTIRGKMLHRLQWKDSTKKYPNPDYNSEEDEPEAQYLTVRAQPYEEPRYFRDDEDSAVRDYLETKANSNFEFVQLDVASNWSRVLPQ
jgi:hypothetical protein